MQITVTGDLSGQYTIDTLDMWVHFRYAVESFGDDLLRWTPSKEVYSYDWKGQNGKQYDLTKRFYDDKEATISGVLAADDEDDFWERYIAFENLWKAPGIRTIYSHEMRQSFGVFFLEMPSVDRLTRLRDYPGKIGVKFDLKLKVLYSEFGMPDPGTEPVTVLNLETVRVRV